jgi:hypothetical protein
MARTSWIFAFLLLAPLAAELPPGFVSITPGPELQGWHISQVNHHGNTRSWKVENGVVSVTQDREGNGGILLTDKKYRDFEVYLEMRPDFGCDSGLFLRSSEKGEAYQVMLDYLEKGNMGGIYGERLKGVKGARGDWEKAWKKGEWNSLRARIEGAVPHITVWINGVQVTDWTDTANHAVGGAEDGMISLQIHGGNRCTPGKYHRFRNIGVKEL